MSPRKLDAPKRDGSEETRQLPETPNRSIARLPGPDSAPGCTGNEIAQRDLPCTRNRQIYTWDDDVKQTPVAQHLEQLYIAWRIAAANLTRINMIKEVGGDQDVIRGDKYWKRENRGGIRRLSTIPHDEGLFDRTPASCNSCVNLIFGALAPSNSPVKTQVMLACASGSDSAEGQAPRPSNVMA